MKLTDGSWKTFLARTLVFGAVVSLGVFVAVRAATARDGVAGGNTRDRLSFAGTLTGNGLAAGSAVTLTFRFHRPGGAATPLCESRVPALIGANNGVAVEVPIDADTDGGPRCPAGMFDGSDVQFDVLVTPPSGGTATEVATNQSINPVPYARYADRVGTPDCPTGYSLDTSDATAPASQRLCVRTVVVGTRTLRDEVVKVGVGTSAFWIDRFESSVHRTDTGAQLAEADGSGGGPDDINLRLPRNGQRTGGDASVVALSHAGFPSVNVTWFQANEACRASGKRLPAGDEWLAAASGTLDNSTCNVMGSGARPATTAGLCRSLWGAHDLIGNLTEWTAEWYAGLGGDSDTTSLNELRAWPVDGYSDDRTTNIRSGASNGVDPGRRQGVPSAVRRGGGWAIGTSGGTFHVDASSGPSSWDRAVGFRCVIPR